MPYGSTPGFDEPAASDVQALQNLIGRQAAQRQQVTGQQELANIQAQGEQARQTQAAGYLSVSPDAIQTLHPEAQNYIKALGQPQPNGTYSIHPSVLQSILQHGDIAQKRDDQIAGEMKVKQQIEDAYRDPDTGVPKIPAGFMPHYARLGTGTLNDKDYEQISTVGNALELRSQQGGGLLDPTDPDVKKQLAAGWTIQTTRKIDPKTGLTTPTQKLIPPKNSSVYDRQAALETLQSQGAIPEDADLGSLNARQNAAVSKEMIRGQAEAAGQRAIQITTGTEGAKAQGPLSRKELIDWIDPKTGQLAVQNPNNYGLTGQQLQQKGLVQVSGIGGGAQVASVEMKAKIADNHLDLIDKKIDDIRARRPELFPPAGDGIAMQRAQQMYRQLLAQGDPDLSELQAYGRQALNFMPAIAPDKGTRLGLGILRFMEGSLPTDTSLPWSYESAKASIQALRGGIQARRSASGLQAVQGGAVMGGGPQAAPSAPRAGSPAAQQSVSGSSFGTDEDVRAWRQRRQQQQGVR